MLFKKLKLSLLIAIAFLKREKKIVFFSSVAGIALFFLVIKVFPYLPRTKMTQKIGMVGNYNFNDLPLSILTLASISLVKIDEDGTFLPSLASKWEVSEDGKTYLFYLADNIYWQDGKEITADEIKYDLPEVKNEVINKKTLKFTLKEPFTPFPTLLSHPVFKKDYLGAGKYQIKKIEKNGPFINKIFLTGPDKNLFFKFYPTQTTAFLAFKLGEIDELPSFYQNPFDISWQKYLLIEDELNNDQYIGVFLNLRDKFLGNKNLRQALAYATPKIEDKTRAIGPLNPQSWAFNPNIKPYIANTAQAKTLFDKFKKEMEVEKLKLKMDTTENFLGLAEEIKKNWEEILGIETEIKLIDTISFDFQTLLIVSQIPIDPDQYSFWHSTQETNLTGYKSPKVDKILEDGRRLSGNQERKEKYQDFQKFLLEDCPVIFLSYPRVLNIKRKTLSIF